MVLALVLPAELRLAVVAAAFLAGIGVERYRQGRTPLPPALGATAAELWPRARSEIGPGYMATALLLIAAAIAVLIVYIEDTPEPGVEPAPAPEVAGGQPRPEVRDHRLGETFTVQGASFRPFLGGGQDWARDIRSKSPGAGRRWIVMGLAARSVRRRLNPSVLSYRLRGHGGRLYAPERRGAVGPPALARRGFLRPGEGAEVRLGFRVPESARRLVLVFEPSMMGTVQVRVRLPAT